MYQVYAQEKDAFSKNLVGEFDDIDEAIDAAEEAIKSLKNGKYTVEKLGGHVNIYGEPESIVVAEN